MNPISKIGQGDPGETRLIFFCPACGWRHAVPVTGPRAWGFNGNTDSPTLSPSVKVEGPKPGAVCHFDLINGVLKFHNDCTQGFSERNVPLQPIPQAS
jgi:hypothetical protein